MLCSLPMYPHESLLAEFWNALRRRLTAGGLAGLPTELGWPQDYLAHWRSPELLLSQTCGYPAATLLAEHVQVLGAFHYALPGCSGYQYSSRLTVRRDDPRQQLADFRHARAVCNEPHSQSGCHSLRELVAPLAQDGRFFSSVTFSGAHRLSARQLAAGEADIAALDCISVHLLQQQEPEVFAQLRCIGHTASAPGLPLVTARDTPPAVVTLLRQALATCVRDPLLQPLLRRLHIADFSVLDAADYQVCRQRAEAILPQLAPW
ncbi:phosphate/phosphite/phosphonate ABC transporter substrate-binding protein [Vogesella sp. LIG4]|uniref:phosphate/phosphite/phosphonate ABC transporter substrate-binding protein n=1 Tax=Vogesella sp. LIG4 TaxID=1192162 RepID=UPI00081FC380|nr:PhnD/SsuA/transferrin family substrate-binding protein [Vogesella sp. LIG4]SCK16615.1 ABC-type phosphate/phosphonate transport system, substrate-binding protein [Vogesella sp. LIG4]